MSLSQQIKESMTPTWHHMMLTLITQGVVCRCPHHKVTIIHFKLSSLEQNQSNSHLMREELSSTLWRGNNFSIRYLEFFCSKKLCFFPFICFFNHLIIAVWTYDIYFILCVLTLFFQFYITIFLLFFKLPALTIERYFSLVSVFCSYVSASMLLFLLVGGSIPFFSA